MPDRPNLPELPGLLLQITGLLTESAISGIRNFLYDSLTWLGMQAESISDYPAIQNTEAARQLRKTGDSLKEAGSISFEAIYQGIHRSAEMLTETLLKLRILNPQAFADLGRDIVAESIVGDSFLSATDPWSARTSFRRLDAETKQYVDATPAEAVQEFRASGLSHPILCIAGLLQDESLWHAGQPLALSELFRRAGYHPIFVRINPAHRLPELGLELAALLQSFADALDAPTQTMSVISFSHGGLILRSALIAAQARGMGFVRRIDRAILISSPDGGYFVEKTGFLFGFGFGQVPGRALRFMSLAGGQQAPAFRDMATATIRKEDMGKPGPVFASSPDRYFGEFEGIEAYQIYSLIADSNHIWSNWLGDGLIEKSSLAMLSDLAFRPGADGGPGGQERPEEEHLTEERPGEGIPRSERLHCIIGPSHFQILQSAALQPILQQMLLPKEQGSDQSPSR